MTGRPPLTGIVFPHSSSSVVICARMPRQKFCSVPGCLSTTDVIKREQEAFLSTFCEKCTVQRPCRCPAPDIYTTRRETRTKFASWCAAIGLKSPGYYINVCYKHFSTGCPSRSCPNPDVVQPIWEKHIRDKMNNNGVVKKPICTTKRLQQKSSSSKKPTTTTTSSSSNLAPSLLRHALLLPKTPLPRASVAHHRGAVPINVEAAKRGGGGDQQYVSTLLPTTISLPQTPVPVALLRMSSCSTSTSTSSCSNNNSSGGTNDELDLIKVDEQQQQMMMLVNPLLDQSEDPCLNEGNNSCISKTSLFATITDLDLDNSVNKWLEICDSINASP